MEKGTNPVLYTASTMDVVEAVFMYLRDHGTLSLGENERIRIQAFCFFGLVFLAPFFSAPKGTVQ